MIVDICDQEGRTQALDLLRAGGQRACRTVAGATDAIGLGTCGPHRSLLCGGIFADLVSVADGIDARTAEGRLALSVLLSPSHGWKSEGVPCVK